MRPPQYVRARVRPPRRWLGVAFLGVWLYLISQIFQVYDQGFAGWVALSLREADQVLAITSNLGQMLFLAGLVAALWRSNLAAGLSSSAVRGLAFGSAGVGVLVLFEAALLLDWVEIGASPIGSLVAAYRIGSIFGVVLGLAGIASLGVGLTQAVRLFGREEEMPRPAAGPEETS